MSSPAPIFVDGQWFTPRSKVLRPILNPATLDQVGLTVDCTAEDTALAVEAAARAQPAWWRVPGVEKARLLREAAGVIRSLWQRGQLPGVVNRRRSENTSPQARVETSAWTTWAESRLLSPNAENTAPSAKRIPGGCQNGRGSHGLPAARRRASST